MFFKNLFIKRFELTTFSKTMFKHVFLLNYLNYSFRKSIKSINIIFSQVNNVNSFIGELKKLNIIRKYLIKSYQGYCHLVGKPVRGQRTWSNS
jgi:ribosomal protein S13